MPWAQTQGPPGRRALGLKASLAGLGPRSRPRALGPGSKPWVLAGRAMGPLGLYIGDVQGREAGGLKFELQFNDSSTWDLPGGAG